MSFAALIDALRHKGAARPSRFSGKVCTHPYAPGLSASIVDAFDATARANLVARVLAYPPAKSEPPVRHYAKH